MPNGKGSLIAAFYQTGPVLDGAEHVVAVGKVERRSDRLVGFDIVDFEGGILGEPWICWFIKFWSFRCAQGSGVLVVASAMFKG